MNPLLDEDDPLKFVLNDLGTAVAWELLDKSWES